ncbi:MAG: hypothetical protein JRH11_10865 [Deltaproteobacteria bacterium]|nr:hypothetical protein [Deltaproteobacteria bacterium]
MLRGLAALALLVFAVFGCGAEPDCIDEDGDGYGAGCALGDDCDDSNAGRETDCETVPPPDCTLDPFGTGCPCLVGSVTGCYAGPEETRDVGSCRVGRATCINGHWGLCEGAVLPRGEICDTFDQDCDGLVDEGVTSPCGGCASSCRGGVWGEAYAPFVPGPGAVVGDAGALTLAYAEDVAGSFVWIANSGEGTLSKIDAARAVEVARYDTGGAEPSRVAVDYRGDVWVTNREFDGVSSVTKVAGDASRCIDRDGDGLVTSLGPDHVLSFGVDECVLFRVPVGAIGEVARSLAIDGERGLDEASGGNAWVGLHDGQAVIVLDGITGDVIERIETPGFSPYAAAFDAWGTLFMSSRDGFLARIDRGERPRQVRLIEVPLSCYLLYGLSIDGAGRVLATGFSCDDVVSYDPLRDRFTELQTPPSTRGIAVRDGDVFVAHTAGLVSRIDPSLTSVLDTAPLTDEEATDGFEPFESIGVGIDAAGDVWVASSQGAPDGGGVATRLSGVDLRVTAQVPLGFAPHTQGDLTGAELRGGFGPEGEAAHVFSGCLGGGATEWIALHLAAFAGSNGSVEVSVRRASTVPALAAVPWAVLGTFPGDAAPYALDLPLGGFVEVRLVLRTDARDGAPRVTRVGLEWRCPGPI